MFWFWNMYLYLPRCFDFTTCMCGVLILQRVCAVFTHRSLLSHFLPQFFLSFFYYYWCLFLIKSVHYLHIRLQLFLSNNRFILPIHFEIFRDLILKNIFRNILQYFTAAFKYKLCTQCLKHFHWHALYLFYVTK
jgi:hypothetical protein